MNQREEFERRFRRRQEIFLSALEGMTSATSTWQCYRDDQLISDEGIVTSVAVKDGQPLKDLEDFKTYCRNKTGQGYQLEVVVDADCNFHAVSWEDIQPDWPGEIDAVLYVRWNTVGVE